MTKQRIYGILINYIYPSSNFVGENMKLIKYLALCLTTLSCTQTFCFLWHETTPIFDSTKKVVEYLKEHNIAGGYPILSKECIFGEGHKVVVDCDSSEENTSQFFSMAKIMASLAKWFILKKPEKYQVTRTFEKQFTCFGLLNWLGIRSNEKNRLFTLRISLFEKPGITQTKNYLIN